MGLLSVLAASPQHCGKRGTRRCHRRRSRSDAKVRHSNVAFGGCWCGMLGCQDRSNLLLLQGRGNKCVGYGGLLTCHRLAAPGTPWDGAGVSAQRLTVQLCNTLEQVPAFGFQRSMAPSRHIAAAACSVHCGLLATGPAWLHRGDENLPRSPKGAFDSRCKSPSTLVVRRVRRETQHTRSP